MESQNNGSQKESPLPGVSFSSSILVSRGWSIYNPRHRNTLQRLHFAISVAWFLPAALIVGRVESCYINSHEMVWMEKEVTCAVVQQTYVVHLYTFLNRKKNTFVIWWNFDKRHRNKMGPWYPQKGKQTSKTTKTCTQSIGKTNYEKI